MDETLNAIIERTDLGYSDHGLMTIWLHLDYGEGSHQGFGGMVLDKPPTDAMRDREPTVLVGKCLAGILRTLEVDTWEKVAGHYVRVRRDRQGKITHVGHLLKNKWFSFEEIASAFLGVPE